MTTSDPTRTAFLAARQKGLRAKEAAESIGLTEGAALAAFAGEPTPRAESPAGQGSAGRLCAKTPLA